LLGDDECSLGDAKSSLGDAKSLLGDAESLLGDTKSSLVDAKSLLGDGQVERAMARVMMSLDSSSPPTTARTDLLEDLVAYLQVRGRERQSVRQGERARGGVVCPSRAQPVHCMHHCGLRLDSLPPQAQRKSASGPGTLTREVETPLPSNHRAVRPGDAT
jgi:hypothetical protein